MDRSVVSIFENRDTFDGGASTDPLVPEALHGHRLEAVERMIYEDDVDYLKNYLSHDLPTLPMIVELVACATRRRAPKCFRWLIQLDRNVIDEIDSEALASDWCYHGDGDIFMLIVNTWAEKVAAHERDWDHHVVSAIKGGHYEMMYALLVWSQGEAKSVIRFLREAEKQRPTNARIVKFLEDWHFAQMRKLRSSSDVYFKMPHDASVNQVAQDLNLVRLMMLANAQ